MHDQELKFGSATFDDGAVHVSGYEPFPYTDIVKLFHGNVANYVNGIPITQVLTIRVHLRGGKRVLLKEDLDIRPQKKEHEKSSVVIHKSLYSTVIASEAKQSCFKAGIASALRASQ